MQVREIMTTGPVCVTPDTPISEAARLMDEQNVGILPVVDKDDSDKLLGVVTDRDIAIRHVGAGHASSSCKVQEAMTEDVRTCRPDSDVGEVMSLMGSEQVRRIPIVDERGVLVGIVSQADIVLHANDDKAAEHAIEQISRP